MINFIVEESIKAGHPRYTGPINHDTEVLYFGKDKRGTPGYSSEGYLHEVLAGDNIHGRKHFSILKFLNWLEEENVKTHKTTLNEYDVTYKEGDTFISIGCNRVDLTKVKELYDMTSPFMR